MQTVYEAAGLSEGLLLLANACGNETSVARTHSGNGPHEEMDRRAIACFDEALADVGLASNKRLRQVLHDYFAWATTTTMSQYHRSADDAPEGLRILGGHGVAGEWDRS